MSSRSPHVEIYRSARPRLTERVDKETGERRWYGWRSNGWHWRFRSSNGKILSESSEAYNEPRSLVRALELSHPGYYLRDAAQGLTGYGSWYLWPLHNTAETPPIPVRVPAGTGKRWGSRRRR